MRAITLLCIFLSVLFSVRALADDLDTHLQQLKNGNLDQREKAARSLAQPKYKENPIVTQALKEALSVEADGNAQSAIANSLHINGGEDGFQSLLRHARNAESIARVQSLMVLAKSERNTEINPVFLMGLFDKNPIVKKQSAIALSSRADDMGVYPVLKSHLSMADDSEAQEFVAKGIYNSKHPDRFKTLIGALNNRNSGSRIYTARLLASVNDPMAVQALINASNEIGNKEISYEATKSLLPHSIGNKAVITQLLFIYNSTDDFRDKKRMVLGPIIQSHDPRAKGLALNIINDQSPPGLIGSSIELLVKHGEIKDAAAIAALLKSPYANLRERAYQAISMILKKHSDLQQLKLAMKCLPEIGRIPLAQDTRNFGTLIRTFLIAFGAHSDVSPRGVEIQQISDEEHSSLKEALLALSLKISE